MMNSTNVTSHQGPPSQSASSLPILGGGLIVLLCVGAIAASQQTADAPSRFAAECEGLSRIVAGRSHSMLEGAAFRNTARQAYAACVSDPAAFRRIVR